MGDGDGVVIVLLNVAWEIADEVKEMKAFEAQVFEQLSNGGNIIGLYPPNEETRARYEKSK